MPQTLALPPRSSSSQTNRVVSRSKCLRTLPTDRPPHDAPPEGASQIGQATASEDRSTTATSSIPASETNGHDAAHGPR